MKKHAYYHRLASVYLKEREYWHENENIQQLTQLIKVFNQDNVADDPSENNNVIAQNGALANILLKECKAFPHGEIADDPIWKTILDINKFGGTEEGNLMEI